MKYLNKFLLLVGIGLAVFIFMIIIRDVYAFGVDDSYIFFRYAENLSNGHGLVFNPGETPGEGFTSWVWLLLLAFFHYIGVELILTAKILGIIFHFLAAFFLALLVVKVLDTVGDASAKVTALILSGCFLLNYRLIAHSVSGMETSLYVFSLVLLAYLTTRALQAPSSPGEGGERWWLYISIAALGTFLVRPEGIAAGGISLLALAVHRRKKFLAPKTWFYVFIGLVAPLVLFVTWKIFVFGYSLPHSFYHKLIVIETEYGESLRQLLLFFKSSWWLIAAAVPITLYAAIKHKKHLFLYYLFLFIFMTAVYLVFYPAMNYLHRFYIPYLPLLLVMISPGIYFLVKKMEYFKNDPVRIFFSFLLFFILALGMNTNIGVSRFKVKSWSKLVDPGISRARLGVLMSRLPPDVVVANTEMGVIPFYSGLTCIDMAGLTDPYTAHHGISMGYLKKRKTDLVLFSRDVKKMAPGDWNKYTQPYGNVFLSKEFKNNFAFIGRHSNYYLYADKTSPKYRTIKEWGKKYLDMKHWKAKMKLR